MFQLYENMSSPHITPDLAELLKQLPVDAPELIVCSNFIRFFLEYLGFNPLTDIFSGFLTNHHPIRVVDYALRKSNTHNPLSFVSMAATAALLVNVWSFYLEFT